MRFDGALRVECPWTANVERLRRTAAAISRRRVAAVLGTPGRLSDNPEKAASRIDFDAIETDAEFELGTRMFAIPTLSGPCASILIYAKFFRPPGTADPAAVASTSRAAIMNLPAHVPEEALPLLGALTNSPDPVFVTDRHNHIVFWNRSAERILGYSAEDIVGSSCAGALQGCDVYGNRYCSDVCPVTQMAVRNETVRHFDLRFRSKDRRTVKMDVSILNLAVRAPDHFLLVHVLRPSDRPDASQRPDEEPVSPPRPPLTVVRESPDARARKLTSREVEVIGMLAAGHTTPEIASRLHISTLTARNHIQNVLEKLEVHSKAEAVAFAFQKRLL